MWICAWHLFQQFETMHYTVQYESVGYSWVRFAYVDEIADERRDYSYVRVHINAFIDLGS